ncbi:hypothetical protein [Glycomyces sp. MUSA5-2]|uniref:hypothetical protein n=1 Tax=Glycomyces sp. MUSA5-2 TaxID=2053002 RepID=UPI00300B4125
MRSIEDLSGSAPPPLSHPWRDHVTTVLKAMPFGAWTTVDDLAAAFGTSPKQVSEFIAGAQPEGIERILTDTGQLRRSSAFRGIDQTEREHQLAAVGVHLDDSGRADRTRRIRDAALVALAADPVTGLLAEGVRRTWPSSASAVNHAPEQREQLSVLAARCDWVSVGRSGDLLHRSSAAPLLHQLPSGLAAAVGVVQGEPSWPTQALVAIGLLGRGIGAPMSSVRMVAVRSLETGAAVEVFGLAVVGRSVPVLVQTRALPPAPPGPGASGACRRGEHGQCRGRTTNGTAPCSCKCGCERDGRATVMGALAVGDEFTSSVSRRARVSAPPVPDGLGFVRVRSRDYISRAECDTRYAADLVAIVANPRKRSRPNP